MEMIIRVHLMPVLGDEKLDAIKNEHVQQLKCRLASKAPKTVNNVLTVLNVMLKKAVEWDVIEHMPCSITVLPVAKGPAVFYGFAEFERLVVPAKETDARTYLIVLLSGEAGLRSGEMVALEWPDVNLDQ
jgi:integrase